VSALLRLRAVVGGMRQRAHRTHAGAHVCKDPGVCC
jgi:hypothetical protein